MGRIAVLTLCIICTARAERVGADCCIDSMHNLYGKSGRPSRRHANENKWTDAAQDVDADAVPEADAVPDELFSGASGCKVRVSEPFFHTLMPPCEPLEYPSSGIISTKVKSP